MQKFLKQNLLLITVFMTGACVLVVEIVAVRVLSPYYGNTIFTTSSVITTILLALSIGYYAGGKLSDRKPSINWLFGIILSSSICLLGFHFLSLVLLPFLSHRLTLTAGPLVSSLILFLLPAMLLGTLSPYAVKLASLRQPQIGIGTISGKIFFWSTVGSIFGSLLSGFYLIPHFGINHIFISTSLVLFMLGFIPLAWRGFDKKRLIQSLAIMAILASATSVAGEESNPNILYSKDGIYEKIEIFDGTFEGRPARSLKQDQTNGAAAYLDSNDPTDLVFDYTKYSNLYKVFTPIPKEILVIGGGAYSIPKNYLSSIPNAEVSVAEIEPTLFTLAKKYFNLPDDSRLHNYTEDGRRLLADTDKKYDIIFSDVYYSLFSIPPHFTTKEFFELSYDRLNEGGIFLANLIGDLSETKQSLVMSEIKTFTSVFPNSYFFATGSPTDPKRQNIIFVGYKSEKKMNFDSTLITKNPDPIIKDLKVHLIDISKFNLSQYRVLDDNYSPVEYMTGKIL